MLITTGNSLYEFRWDLAADRAQLLAHTGGERIWAGSLLPVLWLLGPDQKPVAVKAALDEPHSKKVEGRAELVLSLGDFGSAHLTVLFDAVALRLSRFEIVWSRFPVPLISLHWGSDILTQNQRAGAPTLEKPFWPSWRAEGFGVAGAKTNPMQSFFRSWDFGHTDIPLGSFGPAMGTPYAAAYPRPTYALSMGGGPGWLCLGAGAIPTAALTLKVRARSASLEWLFREDLWGAPNSASRQWKDPLWLTWAATSWEAYREYFRLFPPQERERFIHQKTFWGTWGDFRVKTYSLRDSVDRAVEQMGADLICIDDPWEEKKGSGRPHPERFPRFADDIAYAHQRKIGVGIWMPVAWLEDPAAEGLTDDDLLLTREGVPIKTNWATDPREEGPSFYCVDPSSPRAKKFLENRAQRIVRDYHPTLLKIDFTYGIPGPDGCAPRDPSIRGEMLAWTFARIVGDAARQLNPAITILSYSINPLWDSVQDQCALDDLGDAGVHEAAGHGQWSVWAALLGDRGRAIMASSGYHWSSETDNLLNTAIIGAAGANLPSRLPNGAALPAERLARRRALFQWHRKTTWWEPLWLDSTRGDLENEPAPRNWGRLENWRGETMLTAVALRVPTSAVLNETSMRSLSWSGSWAIIAQDNASIFRAECVALIPFAPGEIALPRDQKPTHVQAWWISRAPSETAWEWREGKVHLLVDAPAVASDLVGFTLLD